MVTKDWAEQYIGRKWANGARGPEAFDCWGLLFHIYKAHLGIELPEYPNIDAKNRYAVSRVIAEEIIKGEWTQVRQPVDFCGVAIGQSHVGIFLDCDGGVVMHALEKSNVVAQSISSLHATGFHHLEFFQHVRAPCRNLQPV